MTPKPPPKNQGGNQDFGMMALFKPNLSTLITSKRIIKTNSNRLSPVHTAEKPYQKPHSKSPQHLTSKKLLKETALPYYGKKDKWREKDKRH